MFINTLTRVTMSSPYMFCDKNEYDLQCSLCNGFICEDCAEDNVEFAHKRYFDDYAETIYVNCLTEKGTFGYFVVYEYEVTYIADNFQQQNLQQSGK